MKTVPIYGGYPGGHNDRVVGVFTVDDADFEYLSSFRWTRSPRGHVQTSVRRHGVNTQVPAYQLLMGTPVPRAASAVVYLDNDPLNNTRANLRFVPRVRAGSKAPPHRRNAFKGVRRCGTRWSGQLNNRELGLFATPEDAARAYDDAARQAYGPFAWLNFP